MNNTFATSNTIVDHGDITFRPARAGRAIPAYVRGIPSSVWQSALDRSGQRARAASHKVK
jgi:hypothetical protein